MKSNRVHRNGATRSAPVQAKIKTPAAPAEFKIVRLRECPIDNPTIETPPQVADFWRKHVVTAPWFKDDKECLCVFLLNTRHELIGFESISQGTLDTILVHPREVLRPATLHNAAAIIIAHNHPSGDPTPSEADIKITRDLMQAAAVLMVPLLDHVIIGDARRPHSWNSLRALGYFAPERATASAEDTAPGQVKTGRGGVCKEALAAFSELEKSAGAVIALAWMNANEIKECTKANAGWEDFESPLIQAGNLELPRILEKNFQREFSGWRDDVNRMVQRFDHPEMTADDGHFDSHIEEAIHALKGVVRLQANTIDNRKDIGSYFCSFLTVEFLDSAFNVAWKAFHNLRCALDARKIPQAA